VPTLVEIENTLTTKIRRYEGHENKP